MKLFKSKWEKELDSIIAEIKVNLQNNYKDVAHNARKKLFTVCCELYEANLINEETYKKYMTEYEVFTQMMKDYHH